MADITQLSDAELRQQYLRSLPDAQLRQMHFDAEGARKAGYTDSEIAGVKKALEAGYSPAEISDHLSGKQALSVPGGFVLDQPANPQTAALPPGFILDKAEPPQGLLANAADFIKSIPAGAASAMAQLARGEQIESENRATAFGTPNAGPVIPTDVGDVAKLAHLHAPEGTAGRYGAAVGSVAANPGTWLGPGSMAIKALTGGLAALGGEAGGDLAGEPGRLLGSLAAGAAGARVAAPRAVEAAIPTQAELRAAKDAGYTAARNSGVELDPRKFATEFGTQAEQYLSNGEKYAFTGGKDGTAPRTFALLDRIQNPPDDAIVTASGLDTVRKQINNIARETRDFKPTPDAKAAMVLKRLYADYLENVPESHVLAGDPAAYASAIKEANANNSAFERLRTFDARATKAQNAADRQISGSLESQIKSKVGAMLDNPKALRGLTQDEIDQIQLINSGNWLSNSLRQVGKGGAAHVIPVALNAGHAFASPATGIPLWATMIASRLISEGMTKARAQTLAEMLAKRSPLYESRLNAYPHRRPQPLALRRSGLSRAQIKETE